VHDRVWRDGKLKEDTYDWYAQDTHGNVWYLGQGTREFYIFGITRRAGSWEAGRDGAQGGIVMNAAPVVGEQYRQEYYAGHAEDMGKVLALAESITVPGGAFQECLKTEDWTPLERGDVEYKYYCRGVGMVLEVNAANPTGSVTS
jgi:hypothetical protein